MKENFYLTAGGERRGLFSAEHLSMSLSVSNFSALGPGNVSIPWKAPFERNPWQPALRICLGRSTSLLQPLARAHRHRVSKAQVKRRGGPGHCLMLASLWVQRMSSRSRFHEPRCQNEWVFPMIPVNFPLNWQKACFWSLEANQYWGRMRVCVCVAWEKPGPGLMFYKCGTDYLTIGQVRKDVEGHEKKQMA